MLQWEPLKFRYQPSHPLGKAQLSSGHLPLLESTSYTEETNMSWGSEAALPFLGPHGSGSCFPGQWFICAENEVTRWQLMRWEGRVWLHSGNLFFLSRAVLQLTQGSHLHGFEQKERHGQIQVASKGQVACGSSCPHMSVLRASCSRREAALGRDACMHASVHHRLPSSLHWFKAVIGVTR